MLPSRSLPAMKPSKYMGKFMPQTNKQATADQSVHCVVHQASTRVYYFSSVIRSL